MFERFRKVGRLLLVISLGLVAVGLSACSTTDDSQDIAKQFSGYTEKQIFAGGEMALAEHNYRDAIRHFEAMQTNYPFGKDAEQSQLDLIYSYFMTGDYASTIAASQHFIHLYPRSSHTDYAYYMKGLANFKADRTLLQKILPINLAERDVGSMRDSYNDFMVLLQVYPNSPYAADARQHLIYLRDVLAAHEMIVAKFYLRRRAFVAAANRASYVVQHYQHAPQVMDALKVMVTAYQGLGETKMANDAERVLRANESQATTQVVKHHSVVAMPKAHVQRAIVTKPRQTTKPSVSKHASLHQRWATKAPISH